MGQAMPEDFDAPTAADDANLAMQLVLQLPHDAQRSHAVISKMRRLIEWKYDECDNTLGVHHLRDLRRRVSD
jgi:hypothetical protein